MTTRDFIYKVSRDIFMVSFVTLIVFSFLERAEPGFVSYYISFNLLLIIPIIFGTVTVIINQDNKTIK